MWREVAVACLLALPFDVPYVPEKVPVEWAEALDQVCWGADLTSEHGDRTIINWYRYNFARNIETRRQEWRLVQDCPPSLDHKRFPDHRVALEHLQSARKFEEYVCYHADRYRNQPEKAALAERILKDTREAATVWETIYNTQIFVYTPSRRMQLKRLRELLGEDAYYSARLPNWLPDYLSCED